MATPDQVLADAGQWVDAKVPYLWGGVTRFGADCSGFVKAVFAEVGVTIPGRTTSEQAQYGQPVQIGGAGDPFAYAQPGDVIFYGLGNASNAMQHEGIYAGGGQIINEPHTGAVASYAPAAGSASEPISAIRRYTTGTASATPASLTGYNPAGGLLGGDIAGAITKGVTAPIVAWIDGVAVRAALVVFGVAALIIGLARLVSHTDAGQAAEHTAEKTAVAA